MPATRRELLTTVASGALLASSGIALSGTPVAKKRVLRVAQMTDIHVQPEKNAGKGFERALEAVQGEQPDLILMTGDLVMDVLGADPQRANIQWNLFQDVVRANVSVPVQYALGNHDVWGWNKIEQYENHPLFGKQMAQDRLKLVSPYYAFEKAGWKFIILDSTHRKPTGNGYTARLDDLQFEWLRGELRNNPKKLPTMLVSHIPLFCACAFLDGDNEKSGDWRVPGAWMHVDFRRIKDVLVRHPEVKAAISGHIHLVDKVEYLGVQYFCNGAISGGWWGGKYQEFDAGYAILDLYDDGSVDNRYIEYGWKPA